MTPAVRVARDVLRRGGLVAIPTETVYGLAADADNQDAVARTFIVKGRPLGHPLIVHVASLDAAMPWIRRLPEAALALAEACWPGPLTLLLPRSSRCHDTITGGLDTVGVRVPAHPLTLELLTAFDGVTAPSANRFGRVSPTTAAHVRRDLGDDVDYILDGGASQVGVESTIVDCSLSRPQILRSGAISADDIAQLLNGEVDTHTTGPSRAPGMLASHYAPACPVELALDRAAADQRAAEHAGALVIDYGDDLVRAARSLYADLREADEAGAALIVAVLPPAHGLGHAVRDRLTKAAAPRPVS